MEPPIPLDQLLDADQFKSQTIDEQIGSIDKWYDDRNQGEDPATVRGNEYNRNLLKATHRLAYVRDNDTPANADYADKMLGAYSSLRSATDPSMAPKQAGGSSMSTWLKGDGESGWPMMEPTKIDRAKAILDFRDASDGAENDLKKYYKDSSHLLQLAPSIAAERDNPGSGEAVARGIYANEGRTPSADEVRSQTNPFESSLLNNLPHIKKEDLDRTVDDYKRMNGVHEQPLDSHFDQLSTGEVAFTPGGLLDPKATRERLLANPNIPKLAKERALKNLDQQAGDYVDTTFNAITDNGRAVPSSFESYAQQNYKASPEYIQGGLPRKENDAMARKQVVQDEYNKGKNSPYWTAITNGLRQGGVDTFNLIPTAASALTGGVLGEDTRLAEAGKSEAISAHRDLLRQGGVSGGASGLGIEVAGGISSALPQVAFQLGAGKAVQFAAEGSAAVATAEGAANVGFKTSAVLNGMQRFTGVYNQAIKAHEGNKFAALDDAMVAGTVSTVTSLGFGKVGANSIFNNPVARKNLTQYFGNIMGQASKGAIEGFTDEFLNGMVASVSYDDGRTTEQNVKNALHVAAIGLTLGGTMTALHGRGGNPQSVAKPDTTEPVPEFPYDHTSETVEVGGKQVPNNDRVVPDADGKFGIADPAFQDAKFDTQQQAEQFAKTRHWQRFVENVVPQFGDPNSPELQAAVTTIQKVGEGMARSGINPDTELFGNILSPKDLQAHIDRQAQNQTVEAIDARGQTPESVTPITAPTEPIVDAPEAQPVAAQEPVAAPTEGQPAPDAPPVDATVPSDAPAEPAATTPDTTAETAPTPPEGAQEPPLTQPEQDGTTPQDGRRGDIHQLAESVAGANKVLIRGFQSGDPTTLVHETFHALDLIKGADGRSLRDIAMGDQAEAFTNWTTRGGKVEANSVEALERAAHGFEQYLSTGKAPTEALKPVFQRMAAVVKQVYGGLKTVLYNLPQEKGGAVALDAHAIAGYDRLFTGVNDKGEFVSRPDSGAQPAPPPLKATLSDTRFHMPDGNINVPTAAGAPQKGFSKIGQAISFRSKAATRLGIPEPAMSITKNAEGNYVVTASQVATPELFGATSVANTAEAQGLTQAPKEERAPAFYSRLTRVVDEKISNNSTPQQIMATLDPAGGSGVKAEEIKWSGLEHALNRIASENGGKVPKAALMEHLQNEGSVKFEEKTATGATQLFTTVDAQGDVRGNFTSRADAQEYLDNLPIWYVGPGRVKESGDGPTPNTQYHDYTLPGGSNYKETVLTMPPKTDTAPLFSDWMKQKGYPESEKAGKVAEYQREHPPVEKSYTSSHFPDSPGYVAHMRTTERPDSNGSPGLFIEEIQSDRHQEARRKGYVGDQRIITPEMAKYYFGIHDSDWDAMLPQQRQDYVDEIRQGNNPITRDKGTPDAPFRKDWPIQMFKRALRDAVASGKEWIGWADGQTQADRFDLSKQVDSVLWGKETGAERYTINYRKDGRTHMANYRVLPEDLPSLVGKDVAAKIIHSSKSDFQGELSGLDLKVGGEGMRGFYDKILPSEVGKYVKKMGGKVEIGSAENTPIWKVAITPEMADGVTKGQPLFQSKIAKDLPEDLAVSPGSTLRIDGPSSRGVMANQVRVEVTPAGRDSALAAMQDQAKAIGGHVAEIGDSVTTGDLGRQEDGSYNAPFLYGKLKSALPWREVNDAAQKAGIDNLHYNDRTGELDFYSTHADPSMQEKATKFASILNENGTVLPNLKPDVRRVTLHQDAAPKDQAERAALGEGADRLSGAKVALLTEAAQHVDAMNPAHARDPLVMRANDALDESGIPVPRIADVQVRDDTFIALAKTMDDPMAIWALGSKMRGAEDPTKVTGLLPLRMVATGDSVVDAKLAEAGAMLKKTAMSDYAMMGSLAGATDKAAIAMTPKDESSFQEIALSRTQRLTNQLDTINHPDGLTQVEVPQLRPHDEEKSVSKRPSGVANFWFKSVAKLLAGRTLSPARQIQLAFENNPIMPVAATAARYKDLSGRYATKVSREMSYKHGPDVWQNVDPANGKLIGSGSNLHYVDMIEAEMETPNSQPLSDKQRAWVVDARQVIQDVVKQANHEGITFKFLQDAQGNIDYAKLATNFYFPRRAIGAVDTVTNRVVSTAGGNRSGGGSSGSSLREEPTAQNSRKYKTATDAVKDGIVYDADPLSALEGFVKDMFGRMGDKRIIEDPDLQGSSNPASFRSGRRTVRIGDFSGVFDEATANDMESMMNLEPTNKTLAKVAGTARTLNGLKLAGDVATLSIQTLSLLGRTPFGYARVAGAAMRELFSEGGSAGYFLKRTKSLKDMAEAGGALGSVLDHQQAVMNLGDQVASRSSFLGKTYDATYGRFNRFHSTAMDAAAIEHFEAMRPFFEKNGVIDPVKARDAAMNADRSVGRGPLSVFGWSTNRQNIAGIFLAAPSMYVHYSDLLAGAFSKNPNEAKLAWKSIGHLVTANAILYAAGSALAVAAGTMTKEQALERLIPNNKDFGNVRVKMPFSDDHYEVGVGGFYRSLLKAVGKVTSLAFDGRNNTTEEALGPLQAFMSSRASPAASGLLNLWRGTDYMGNPQSRKGLLLSMVTPVGLDQSIRAGVQKAADSIDQHVTGPLGRNMEDHGVWGGQTIGNLFSVQGEFLSKEESQFMGSTLQNAFVQEFGLNTHPVSKRTEWYEESDRLGQILFGKKYADLSPQERELAVDINTTIKGKPPGLEHFDLDHYLRQKSDRVAAYLDSDTKKALSDVGMLQHDIPGPQSFRSQNNVAIPMTDDEKVKAEKIFATNLKRMVGGISSLKDALPEEDYHQTMKETIKQAEDFTMMQMGFPQ